MSKRVATYCRVSSDMQTTDNQTAPVETLAASKGEVVARYVETGSAAKVRPVFEAMLQAAQRGEFDVLCIVAIDRFGRSMVGNVNDVLALDKAGVAIASVREPWLDSGGPVRPLLVAIFSWVAEEERRVLIERTKAGMARAKAEGKVIGGRKRGAKNRIAA
jgi:putative DNA-invertase from lambdoid prophage Rac